MITRRHIRIKVLHHLYAHATDNEVSAASLLKNLEKSTEEVHTLFGWDISAFLRLRRVAARQFERIERRNVPDVALLERVAAFTEIPFFALCDSNAKLHGLMESAYSPWKDYDTHFQKLWKELFESERYQAYLESDKSLAVQKRFLREVYQVHIAENEFLHDLYEDQHAHWSDDLDAAQMMTGKVISSWSEQAQELIVPNLYKDEDDAAFGPMLLRKYFEYNSDSSERIESKSKNWESDRIARLDIILMKLCIAEWRGISEVPIKVSLNEYLDLSKEYSTPKSSAFINGILDKIVANLREEGLLNKVGRGMIN